MDKGTVIGFGKCPKFLELPEHLGPIAEKHGLHAVNGSPVRGHKIPNGLVATMLALMSMLPHAPGSLSGHP